MAFWNWLTEISLSDVIMIFSTFLLVRINWRLLWFPGAIQSHSDQQRRIAAKNAGLKIVWWDPSGGRGWPFDGKHNQEQQIEKIFVGIPEERRRRKPSRFLKLLRGF